MAVRGEASSTAPGGQEVVRMLHRPAADRSPGRPTRPPQRRGVDPAQLGGAGPRPQRPGLPPGLPADRQPARRRGPHPGRVRPGLPLAAPLPARDVRGLAAPDHHQPVPGRSPSPAEDPLRRPGRRLGGAVAERLADPLRGAGRRGPRSRRRRGAGRAAAGVPGRRGAVRHRRSQLRGDQRGARRQDRHRTQPDPPGPCAAAGRSRPPPAHRPAATATWASRWRAPTATRRADRRSPSLESAGRK